MTEKRSPRGDVVPPRGDASLSKLKRWRLKEIVRRTALVPEAVVAEVS